MDHSLAAAIHHETANENRLYKSSKKVSSDQGEISSGFIHITCSVWLFIESVAHGD